MAYVCRPNYSFMSTLRWMMYQLPALLLALGAILRFGLWLQDRSLFIDEASLALNFCEKTYAGLWGPLAYEQYAPPLFSTAVKWCTDVFGHSERALRLFPLWSSLVSIGLFGVVARRYVPQVLMLSAACWVFAFSDVQFHYGTEAKQYSSDVAVALTLLYMALRQMDRPFRGVWWALAGGAAVWLSMPSVFMLFGIGVENLWANRKRWNWQGLYGWVAIVAFWLTSFGVYYVWLLRPSIGVEGLQAYHSAYFFHFWPDDASAWWQNWSLLRSIPAYTAGNTLVAVLFGGLGLGWGLWQSRHDGGLRLLVWPLLACIGASAMGAYSWIPRLMVWLFALMLLLQAAGWQGLWMHAHAYWRPLWVVLLLLTVGLHTGVQFLYQPYAVEEIKPVLEKIAAERAPGDVVWIDHQSKALVQWYTTCRQPALDVSEPVYRANADEMPDAEAFGGAARAWVLFAHLSSRQQVQQTAEAARQSIPQGYELESEMAIKGAYLARLRKAE